MGKLTIIGLGLIGGSMGMALRRAEPENTEVVGYDRSEEVMVRAHKAKVVDAIAPTLEEAVKDATLVIVCTPIVSMRKVFQEIGPHLMRGAVVTDTASTKTDVLRWSDEFIPKTAYFVGGHPMAGKEKQGLHNADESLFDERPYVIVPSVDAAPGAVAAVVGLAQAVNALPMYMDADEHDSYAAAISHLPLLTSVALFNLVQGSNAWPELASMAGPGFRDLTRLASGEPEMSHDIFLTNRANVLHWLNRYIGELSKLADMIDSREDNESLYRTLTLTQVERDRFLDKLPERESAKNVELPSSADAFMTMMTGTLVQQRAKELTTFLEDQHRDREEEERIRRRRNEVEDLDDAPSE
jgi:prephenate dehydrogenase